MKLTVDEAAFWQAVYVAAIRAGNSNAAPYADSAVLALRARTK